MTMQRLISAALRPIRTRLRQVITRAVVVLVDDALKMQALQIRGLDGEPLDNVEHWQPYGFTCHPHEGAEALVLSVGADRSHPVVVAVGDRRYRLKDMAGGEVAVYTDEDQNSGHRIHLKRGKEIHLISGGSSIVITPAGITLTAPAVEFVKS
ncbi:MAG: phage baseplate assembly protein V [Gammaproteobacteria bacterium]|nr:phage baseplate assembly protein V [Gammaproteobacteria bacterium]